MAMSGVVSVSTIELLRLEVRSKTSNSPLLSRALKRPILKAKSPTSEVSASISGSSSNKVSVNDLIPMQLATSFEESDVDLAEALFGLEKPVVIAMPKP
ncbi:hypothetical protein KC348_g19140 [Hortaea werneckii]|nr:hypothetical protein KC348_g19140 [Hortaea werneckii]